MKVLQGNPGKRPLNKREPQPEPVRLPCPRWLSGEARKAWRYVAPQLARLGLLTKLDRIALEELCYLYGMARRAKATLEAEGLTFTTPNGYVQQRPEVAIVHKCSALMKGYLAEFGMTASSRSKISLPEPERADPFEEFLRGKVSGE
ncbi:MAG: phage terminase small subunit P27 family [Sideroxydans sp.]|nr:phage terminase small subunit P27 family [Sideroxydans sp.]